MQRNVAGQTIGVQMVSASDGSAFTGAVSVFFTLDNGTQTAGSGTAPAHKGNGYHTYGPSQAETDGAHVGVTWTGTGAVPVSQNYYPSHPQTGDAYQKLLDQEAAAPTTTDIAEATLLRDWALITSPVPERCLLQGARFLRNKWDITAGTPPVLKVRKEDDTAVAWQADLTHDANAEPIVGKTPSGP